MWKVKARERDVNKGTGEEKDKEVEKRNGKMRSMGRSHKKKKKRRNVREKWEKNVTKTLRGKQG